MKRRIFGRKVGSSRDFFLMIKSEGTTSGGREVDPDKLRQFEIDSTRRAVKSIRERNVEGYVLFGEDPTYYTFTPSQDFVYPAKS